MEFDVNNEEFIWNIMYATKYYDHNYRTAKWLINHPKLIIENTLYLSKEKDNKFE